MSEKLIEKSSVNNPDGTDVYRGIYVCFDKRAETYSDPICLASSLEALRYFASNLITAPDVIIKDLVIFEIAKYIPSKGQIVSYFSDTYLDFAEITSEELLKEVTSMREFLKSIKHDVDKEDKR